MKSHYVDGFIPLESIHLYGITSICTDIPGNTVVFEKVTLILNIKHEQLTLGETIKYYDRLKCEFIIGLDF